MSHLIGGDDTFRVGMTTYRDVSVPTFGSFINLCRSLPKMIVDIESGSFTAPARCRIAQRFMNGEKEDFLLFVDSDMDFTPEDVEKLHIALKKNPKMGAVCGHYARRSSRGSPIANWKGKNGLWLAPPEQHKRIKKYVRKGSVAPVDVFGAGLLLINRQAFEKIDKPWFEAVHQSHPMTGELIHWTEDYWFSAKLKEAGFKPSVHFGVFPGHVGNYTDRISKEKTVSTGA